MNRFESITKSLRWFMALLLVAFVTGCGGGGGGGGAESPALSSTKAVTAYSLAGVTGTINETAKSIAVTVPFGTNVTAQIATFTTTGASVKVGAAVQTSATTANDFTSPVAYTVTAADSSTATYTVTVTVAANSAKAITAYSLAGVTGTIDQTAKTIAVTMPFGTNVTALVATFTTTGAGVPTVGGVNQTSGITANNFSTSKAYLVTAADGTTATYTVTVTVALSSAKAITAYSFAVYPGATGTITEPAHTIAVTVPSGTNVTALVATFTTTGASVKVGATVQVSGTTPNNFTTPKAYIVTAADGSTATYTVTVSLAAGPPAVNLRSISTNNFVILATSMITEATPANGAITGNIGVSPAAGSTITVTCAEMSTWKVYQVDDTFANAACSMSGTVGGGVNKTLVDQAVVDMGLAYTAASDPATPAGVGASNLNLLGGNLPAGTNFTPGVYTWGSNVNINGNITLTGGASDVWIFQMSGNLAIASCGACASAADGAAIKVILSGGAVASNVFWQVGGATTTLGTYSTFNGNILTAPAGLIAIQTGAVLHGRALSGTSVALDGNAVGP